MNNWAFTSCIPPSSMEPTTTAFLSGRQLYRPFPRKCLKFHLYLSPVKYSNDGVASTVDLNGSLVGSSGELHPNRTNGSLEAPTGCAWLRNPDLWFGRRAYITKVFSYTFRDCIIPFFRQLTTYNVLQRESLYLLLFTLHLSFPSSPLATKSTI